jgi:hypothetical protein
MPHESERMVVPDSQRQTRRRSEAGKYTWAPAVARVADVTMMFGRSVQVFG